MDLHQLQSNLWYLHIVDHFSRLSAACLITSKRSNVIIEKVISNWICIYGSPKVILSDNGGEFNNEEFREMAEMFGIEVKTTAAYSPWSNGLVERQNAVLTNMINKIRNSENISIEAAVNWAVYAKNSLQNVFGYSPFQLVFGKNPTTPSTMTDKLPALSSATSSEIVANNLNALNSARKSFIAAEADSKLKKALRKNVYNTEQNHFENGDKVFYKRDWDQKWKGPGRVIGSENAVVLVRHGGAIVRVHCSRLQNVDGSASTEEKKLNG